VRHVGCEPVLGAERERQGRLNEESDTTLRYQR
jgi:hypothetical protein